MGGTGKAICLTLILLVVTVTVLVPVQIVASSSVQSQSGDGSNLIQHNNGFSNSLSVLVKFTAPVTRGNVVVVAAYEHDTGNPPSSVSDTLGLSYTQLVTSRDGSPECVTIYVANVTMSGSDNVTVAAASGASPETGAHIFEVSGVTTSGAQTNHNAGFSNTISVGAIGFRNGAFLLGIMGDYDNLWIYAGSGFALSRASYSGAEYATSGVSSPSTFPFSFIPGYSDYWAEAAVALNPTLAKMFVSYSVVGGGSPTAPVFHYVLNETAKSLTLSKTAKQVQVDAGSTWNVTSNPLRGSSSTERWDSNQTLTGTASSTTLVFTFYHQTLQKLSYSIIGDAVRSPSAPVFQAKNFTSPAPVTLTTMVKGYWFDYGSSWTVTNPLVGSDSSERWYTTQKTSGTIDGGSTVAFKYQHQFYLTMLVSPSGDGSVRPGSGWQDAGAKVSIMATAKTGYRFLNWTGSGKGSYSGTKNPATIMMNASITETAKFEVMITITSTPTGSGYVLVDGVAVKTPETFAWVVGSTYNITAVTALSCGTGCQYVFASWSDAGARSHIITTPGSPTTYTATFQKQYMLTIEVSPLVGGTVNATTGWQNAGEKITLEATPNSVFVFAYWKGTGSGSYSGIINPAKITMNSAITEDAYFV